jgi:hypothetical protein
VGRVSKRRYNNNASDPPPIWVRANLIQDQRLQFSLGLKQLGHGTSRECRIVASTSRRTRAPVLDLAPVRAIGRRVGREAVAHIYRAKDWVTETLAFLLVTI